jgi:hypothetical protein
VSNFFFRTGFTMRRGRPTTRLGFVPRAMGPERMTSKSARISFFRAAQMFQTATSIARAARGSRRIFLRVMQWLVLCGIPYRGPGALSRPHLTLRTSFPNPNLGRAQRPPESSIASMQLSKNSTGHLCLQPALALSSSAVLQLFENSNDPA